MKISSKQQPDITQFPPPLGIGRPLRNHTTIYPHPPSFE